MDRRSARKKKVRQEGEECDAPSAQRARDILLLDEPEMLQHPQGLGGLLQTFTDFQFESFKNPNRELNSLNNRILQAYSEDDPTHPVWLRSKTAAEMSQTLFLQMVLGTAITKRDRTAPLCDLQERAFWRYIELNPNEAMRVPLIKEIIAQRSEKEDASFFVKFGAALAKSMKANRHLDINLITLKMAQYWTHPDFPLWMMNNEAGSRFVEHLLKTAVSAENYAQIIKRQRLIRFGRFPICGIRIASNHEFTGFEFAKWLKQKFDTQGVTLS